jgi:acyl-coenzyme A synthetase/AMP-(fatty) acid ligase
MPVPAPCPAPFNLAAYVLAAGRQTPDKIALELLGPTGAERWSFAQIEAAVLGTASGLLEQGLQPGDRVLFRLGNGVSFPIAYLAAIAVGLVPIPTSVQLTAREISQVATMLGPKLALVSDGVAAPEGIPQLCEATLDELAGRAPADYLLGDPDRLAYVIMTSGTGGRPRAVAHAHRAVWARRMMWDGWYGLTSGDRLMHAGAFNWTYTLGTGLMDPWARGATALIPAAGTSPAALPELLIHHRATILAAAPGVYRQMLRAVDGPLEVPALRHGLSAGEKLPEALRTAWRAATGTDLHEAYGQSEISTFISGAPDRPAPANTLGYAQAGRRMTVTDEAGQPVPPGQPGKMAVHRTDPGLMLGYLDDGVTPRLPLSGEWFLTGDTVEVSPDGAVSYLGRDDDIMNAGGYRVSPVEVEAALTAHPGVDDAAAAEVEVKPGTTVIAAWYTGPVALDEAELREHASARLARYKTPRIFIHCAELPRGANGKLLRRQLRQAYPRDHDQA